MGTIRIGIVGQYQSGKSLLINCLLGRSIASVGNGVATTHTIVNYIYSDNEYVDIVANGRKVRCTIEDFQKLDTDSSTDVINVYLNNPLLANFELIDMPGFGNDNYDNKQAIKALKSIDYAIVIASNYKTIGVSSPAFKDFCRLQQYNIPYYFFLNCTDFLIADKWMPKSTINYNMINDYLRLTSSYKPINFTTDEDQIPIVNLMWYWYSISDSNDEILQCEEIQNAIRIYQLEEYKKNDIRGVSRYELIENIFSMDNKMYLELKRELKTEIAKLKDEVCPVGTIQAFAFNRIPNGWMICDGRLLNMEEYRVLYQAIGTTFGGDGKSNFAIPDMRGRFIRGWSADGGDIDRGRCFGSEQKDALQSHKHKFDINKILINSSGEHSHTAKASTVAINEGMLSSVSVLKWLVSSGDDSGSTTYDGGHNHQLTLVSNPISNAIDVNSANESRPVNIALSYCIKVGLQDE